MFYKILVLTLFLFSALNHIKTTDCVFISSGVYPNYVNYGINLPDCGYMYLAETVIISRTQYCFLKSSGNISIVVRAGRYSISDQITSRIFKGKDAVDGESPWTVRVEYLISDPDTLLPSSASLRTKTVYCTGSLITFRWVLTSANCSILTNMVGLNVVAGREGQKRSAKIGNIFKHAQFPVNAPDSIDQVKHDIALIKLDNDFKQEKNEYNFYLNTICLPNEVLETDERQIATMTGWGAISETVSKPRRLQIATIRIKPGELCNDRKVLCAEIQEDEPRPCYGDNGGPLYQFSNDAIPKAVQIGVYRGGGFRGCTSGHTRKLWIPPMLHIQWILKTVRDNN